MSRIVVIGGALPGMAAAARLAKVGHQVTIVESEPVLGGRWSAPGVLAPVLDFPAPWKDLLRKSGRGFDAELARTGLALVAAPPAEHVFDDGTTLIWPSDRGGQWHALADHYGRSTADRWRDLLDALDATWQRIRPLGLEAELASARQLREAGRLTRQRTVADLAASVGQAQLAHLVRDTAWRAGSDPARTPGWMASRLSVERLFGRWLLVDPAGVAQDPRRLIDILSERLATRKVAVLHATAIAVTSDLVRTDQGDLPADVIISTVHPWTHAALIPGRLPRLRLAQLQPATAPQVTHRTLADASNEPFRHIVRHTASGPIDTFRWTAGDGVHEVVHDYPGGAPERAAGLAWTRPSTWLRRPAVRTATPALYRASSAGRGGIEPWAQLLEAALASYAAHERLTGADIRPSNRDYRP